MLIVLENLLIIVLFLLYLQTLFLYSQVRPLQYYLLLKIVLNLLSSLVCLIGYIIWIRIRRLLFIVLFSSFCIRYDSPQVIVCRLKCRYQIIGSFSKVFVLEIGLQELHLIFILVVSLQLLFLQSYRCFIHLAICANRYLSFLWFILLLWLENRTVWCNSLLSYLKVSIDWLFRKLRLLAIGILYSTFIFYLRQLKRWRKLRIQINFFNLHFRFSWLMNWTSDYSVSLRKFSNDLSLILLSLSLHFLLYPSVSLFNFLLCLQFFVFLITIYRHYLFSDVRQQILLIAWLLLVFQTLIIVLSLQRAK